MDKTKEEVIKGVVRTIFGGLIVGAISGIYFLSGSVSLSISIVCFILVVVIILFRSEIKEYNEIRLKEELEKDKKGNI